MQRYLTKIHDFSAKKGQKGGVLRVSDTLDQEYLILLTMSI